MSTILRQHAHYREGTCKHYITTRTRVNKETSILKIPASPAYFMFPMTSNRLLTGGAFFLLFKHVDCCHGLYFLSLPFHHNRCSKLRPQQSLVIWPQGKLNRIRVDFLLDHLQSRKMPTLLNPSYNDQDKPTSPSFLYYVIHHSYAKK